MFVGTLAPVSNRAHWIDCLQLLDEDDPSEGVDIDDATAITLEVRGPRSHTIALTGTLANGVIAHVDTGVIQWTFTATQMSELDPGDYDVGLTIVMDSITTQLLIGTLPVLDGIMS